jgi:hypothetical protein
MTDNKLSFLLAFFAFIASCHAGTVTEADRCVLVDLQQEQGKQLFPVLEKFARENGMEVRNSNPIAPHYVAGSTDQPSAEIVYRIGFGRFGAELAFFKYDAMNDGLELKFDRFVESSLKPQFKVKQCRDEENFKLPVMQR